MEQETCQEPMIGGLLRKCQRSFIVRISPLRMAYDSLSRVIEDTQVFGGNTRNATNEKFTSYPVTQMAFPDGRQVSSVLAASVQFPILAASDVGEAGLRVG